MNNFDDMVNIRCNQVKAKASRPYGSAHEGFALLLEEVDELWDEVKKKTEDRAVPAMLNELVDIVVVAKRMAEDLGYFKAARDSGLIDWKVGKAYFTRQQPS